MEFLEFGSNWTISNPEKSLKKCLSISDSEFHPETVDPTNCVQLLKSENEEFCQLCLETRQQNVGFSKINLISQSKRVEIFEGSPSHPGAYITTLTGTLLGLLKSIF